MMNNHLISQHMGATGRTGRFFAPSVNVRAHVCARARDTSHIHPPVLPVLPVLCYFKGL